MSAEREYFWEGICTLSEFLRLIYSQALRYLDNYGETFLSGVSPFPDATLPRQFWWNPPHHLLPSIAPGFPSSWSGPHTPLIQITSLTLIPVDSSNDRDDDYGCEDDWLSCWQWWWHDKGGTPISHSSCCVSSSLSLMSWSTKTLM